MRKFLFFVFVFVFVFSYPFFSLFSQEIRVVRGKGGEFPKKYQGKAEGSGIFFGMADLPIGRIVTLTKPGMSHNMDEQERKRTAQIVIVKQMPTLGRLRSSEVVLSPRGADFFNVKSEMFLVTDNSSVRWTDNIPPVTSEVVKKPFKERFNEMEYVLEPAAKRPPKQEIELKDVVDEFENTFTPPPPQRIEIDVNVGVSHNEPNKEFPPPPPSEELKLNPVIQENIESQLNSKMVSSMPPGIYIQLGYYAKRDSLLKMLRQVGAKYDVKILPENNGSEKNYRFFIGNFSNENDIPAVREDLYKLGLTDFFVVRR